MLRVDLEHLSPAVQAAVRDMVGQLEGLEQHEHSRQTCKVASVLLEYCAFETAVAGDAAFAARVIQIASELDGMSRKTP